MAGELATGIAGIRSMFVLDSRGPEPVVLLVTEDQDRNLQKQLFRLVGLVNHSDWHFEDLATNDFSYELVFRDGRYKLPEQLQENA
jgi:hypothetical protein